MKTESELDKLQNLVDEEVSQVKETRPGQLARNKKNSEIIQKKIAAGIFVSGNLKYTEEVIINFLDGMFQWFLTNPDKIFMEEYYMDPGTDKSIPYGSLKKTYGRHESCDEIRAAIKKVLEIRLAKAALSGVYKENFTKFLFINNFGYKEKVEQDVILSSKEVKFDFGNPELKQLEEGDETED